MGSKLKKPSKDSVPEPKKYFLVTDRRGLTYDYAGHTYRVSGRTEVPTFEQAQHALSKLQGLGVTLAEE